MTKLEQNMSHKSNRYEERDGSQSAACFVRQAMGSLLVSVDNDSQEAVSHLKAKVNLKWVTKLQSFVALRSLWPGCTLDIRHILWELLSITDLVSDICDNVFD